MKASFILLFICSVLSGAALAQPGRSYAHDRVRRGVEQKMDSTYRKKGRKSVQDVTYEHDTRYKDATNKVQATILFVDSSFKKGDRLKGVMSTKMVFGKKGEAYVIRDELKEQDLQWLIFNYADKANYMVMPKEKQVMKMPLINFKKMVEKAARREADRMEEGGESVLKATDEYAVFGGYKARKFVETLSNGKTMDLWVSTALKLNLGNDYVLGARLDTYKFPQNTQYREMANGFVVRSVMYDGKGRITGTRTLASFSKSADEKYFDLSSFKMTDVMGGL